MPADANARYEPGPATQLSGAKMSATETGIADWKTIAPVMLPIASVSLPCRTQMIELNFSGSSVAIGAITSVSSTSSTPSDVATCPDGIDECDRADDDQPERDEDLQVDRAQAWAAVGRRRSTGIEAMEPQRREVLDVDRRVRLEVGLHVPPVDHEEHDRDDDLRPRGIGRKEDRGGDREPVRDDEGPHVRADDMRVDRHDVALGPVTGLVHDRQTGHEHRQRREHEWRPEDRADADLVGVLVAREQDRDDRDHRLGQGRPDGGEDGPDRALGEPELPPEPLDAVREQLGAGQDDDERNEEDEEFHGALSLSRAARSRFGSPVAGQPSRAQGGVEDASERTPCA